VVSIMGKRGRFGNGATPGSPSCEGPACEGMA
jgi:hypothetical protein